MMDPHLVNDALNVAVENFIKVHKQSDVGKITVKELMAFCHGVAVNYVDPADLAKVKTLLENSDKSLYYSDIAKETGLDLRTVVSACEKLFKDNLIITED